MERAIDSIVSSDLFMNTSVMELGSTCAIGLGDLSRKDPDAPEHTLYVFGHEALKIPGPS